MSLITTLLGFKGEPEPSRDTRKTIPQHVLDREEADMRTLDALRKGCVTVPELMEELGVGRDAVQRALNRLVTKRVISRHKRGNQHHYTPRPL